MAIRKDVRRGVNASGWSSSLEWYARAVAAMQARPINDRTSWRYVAAIHGFDKAGWTQKGLITPTDPLPPAAEQKKMWDQCQHGGWYFLPWHRGYLSAFEAAVAKTIAALGGPADWAMPYWNYLDSADPKARNIPPAFLAPTLPDGTHNMLSSWPRGGVKVLGPTPWLPRDITLAAMGVHRFTAANGTVGFGGGTSGFAHFGNLTGAVEGNPHNLVHVMIGGVGATAGFMSDPNYAALDPIFWIHHCNIDRLWAAWLTQSGNIQENGAPWMQGPFPRQFEMPDPTGHLGVFAPAQTLPGGPLAPTYDDLNTGTGVTVAVAAAPAGGAAMPASTSSQPPPAATLVGSNAEAMTVAGVAATTTVRIAAAAADIAAAPVPQRLFLNLENIRGAAPSGVLNVFVSLPAQGTVPASAPELVDTVTLFGLAKAAAVDGPHGANGLTVAIDITELAKSLAILSQSSLDQLQVRIEQPGGEKLQPISVGRVSIFRQPVE